MTSTTFGGIESSACASSSLPERRNEDLEIRLEEVQKAPHAARVQADLGVRREDVGEGPDWALRVRARYRHRHAAAVSER